VLLAIENWDDDADEPRAGHGQRIESATGPLPIRSSM
jgi:hypothetical protein